VNSLSRSGAEDERYVRPVVHALM